MFYNLLVQTYLFAITIQVVLFTIFIPMKKILYFILLLPLFTRAQLLAPTSVTTKLAGWTNFTPSSWYYTGGSQYGYWNSLTNTWEQFVTGRQFNTFTGTATQTLLDGKVSFTVGVVHLADTTALKAYTGIATTYIVDDLKAGGTFVYSATGTADGGITFAKSGGGYFKRIYSGFINVMWFGAKGDNTTDDKISIQKAFNYCKNNSGGTVYIPTATYASSGSLIVYQKTKVIGDGRQSLIRNIANGDLINSTWPINSSTPADITIQDIGLQGTFGSSAGGGFVDQGGTKIHLKNVTISGFKYNVIFDQTELAKIELCNLAQSNTAAIWLVNGADHNPAGNGNFTNRITVIDNQINNSSTVGTGIIDDGGYSHYFNNNNINGFINQGRLAGVNNGFWGNSEMEAASGDLLSFINTTSVLGNGVGACQNFTVDNNIMVPSGTSRCIALTNGSNMTITNNYFASGSGFKVAGCSNVFSLNVANNTNGGGGSNYDSDAARQFIIDGGNGVKSGSASSASSGTTAGFTIQNTLTQTGTAGYSDLFINRLQSTVGSGPQNLLRLAVGGTDKATIDNTGKATFAVAPVFPTISLSDNSTNGVTSAWVKGQSYAPSTGGTGYIQNQIAGVTAGNFWINGTGSLNKVGIQNSAPGSLLNVGATVTNPTGAAAVFSLNGGQTYWEGTTAATDEKLWDFRATTVGFNMRAVNDANSAANSVFNITRIGYVPNRFMFSIPITTSGNSTFGGTGTGTAKVHIAQGTATAGTGPLKIDGGTLLGTTEAGSIENSGTHLYYTAANGGTRYPLDQQVDTTVVRTVLNSFTKAQEDVRFVKTNNGLTLATQTGGFRLTGSIESQTGLTSPLLNITGPNASFAAPAYSTGGYRTAVINTTTNRLETVASGTPVVDATTTSYTMAAGTRYVSDNASLITFTLPTTANVGDIFIITGYGAGLWKISQNSGQTIHGATDTTTGTGGSLTATGRYNSIQIVCVKANTDFTVQSSQGSITVN